MTKYSFLRWMRICISIAATGILAFSLSVGASYVPCIGRMLETVQIGHAVIAFSMSIIIGWLLLTLAFGRIYCSSVCPIGTLQDLGARSVRRFPLDRFGESRRRFRYAAPQNRLRYSALVILVIAIMFGLTVIPSVLEPFSAFNRICTALVAPLIRKIAPLLPGISHHSLALLAASSLSATVLAILILGSVIAVSARSGRRICNTVCPVGTALGFVSRFAIFQMEIDTDLCVNCGKCESVCKGECIDLKDHVVDGSRCVVCFDCANVCPNSAINFTSNRKQLSTPLMQKIIGPERAPQATMDCNGECNQIKKTLK